MKKRETVIATTAVIAAIAAYCLWPRVQPGDPGTQGSFRGVAGRTVSSGTTQYTSKPPLDPRLDFHEKRKNGKRVSVPPEDLENLLAHFSRSPEALSLVFLINNDPKLLLELKDHDKNPTAVAILASYSGSVDEQLYWAKRLADLEPDNAHGKLLESSKLLLSGRAEEALSALAAARACPQLDGGLTGVAQILPEAASFLPKDQLVDLVFDQLNLATTVAVSGLIPFNLRESLAGLSPEKATEVAQSYLDLFKKGESGSGFQVVTGDGLEDVGYLFDSNRENVLDVLTSTKGEKAALSIDPQPLNELVAKILSQCEAWGEHRRSLTPAQVDSIVSQALGH